MPKIIKILCRKMTVIKIWCEKLIHILFLAFFCLQEWAWNFFTVTQWREIFSQFFGRIFSHFFKIFQIAFYHIFGLISQKSLRWDITWLNSAGFHSVLGTKKSDKSGNEFDFFWNLNLKLKFIFFFLNWKIFLKISLGTLYSILIN